MSIIYGRVPAGAAGVRLPRNASIARTVSSGLVMKK